MSRPEGGIYLGATDGAFASRLTQTRALATDLQCALEFIRAEDAREDVRDRASINLLHILTLSS